jgi:hypothetical protein
MTKLKLFQIDATVQGERRAIAVAPRTMEEALTAAPEILAGLDPGVTIEVVAVHACGDVHVHAGVRQ